MSKARQIRGKLTPAKLKIAMPHISFDSPMSYEQIWDATKGAMDHFGWTDGKVWWNIFEYIDFHANGSRFTDLKFSAWLESLEDSKAGEV